MVGAIAGWALTRNATSKDDKKQRIRRDLENLRKALEEFIKVVEDSRFNMEKPYHDAWLNVVLAIGRIEKYEKRFKKENMYILASVPGRELHSSAPFKLKQVARDAISLVDKLMP